MIQSPGASHIPGDLTLALVLGETPDCTREEEGWPSRQKEQHWEGLEGGTQNRQ